MNTHRHQRRKHVLIIGGMGPQASLYAHSLAIKEAVNAGAVNNEDYPRITHLSINVKDFISKPTYKDEARKYILQCLSEINVATVDAAFIACNTAHVLAEDIVKATNLPLISLTDVTREHLKAQPGIASVGILSTPSTLSTGLYQKALDGQLSIIKTTETSSRNVEKIIRSVIAGQDEQKLARALEKEIAELRHRGAQRTILGCTELSLLGSQVMTPDVIDPLLLTVRKAVLER